MKLLLFLSHNGVGSRRRCFDIIRQSKVKVNGKVVDEPSTLINPSKDNVLVSGKLIRQEKYVYLMLNKPQDCVTTVRDKHATRTVFDVIPQKYGFLKPVGRLDKDTQGLLLLTNDGDLAYKITHPKFELDKVYEVVVKGNLLPASIKKLERGVIIDGTKTSSATVKSVKRFKDKTSFMMTIHEGKKRQIRLMLKSVGHHVVFLNRVQQGNLKLGALKLAKYRELNTQELKKLKAMMK